MLYHEHRLTEYYSRAIDVYNLPKASAPRYANKAMFINKSPIAQEVFQSLEGLSSDERVRSFLATSRQYLNDMSVTLKKHIEAFKKGVAFTKETIEPLLKVDRIFTQVYGQEVRDSIIKGTKVNYFPNAHMSINGEDGSLQLFILEKLSLDLFDSTEAMRGDLQKYLECPIGGHGDVEYPALLGIVKTNDSPNTFEGLGYPLSYVDTGINKIVNVGEHIKASTNLLSISSSIDQLIKVARDGENSIQLGSKTVEQDIDHYNAALADLQVYAVTLSSLVVVLQAVSQSAYEAAYKIHMAEIDFNKSKTK